MSHGKVEIPAGNSWTEWPIGAGGGAGGGGSAFVIITDREKELETLLRQVVAVMDSKSYASMCSMAFVHGHQYSGPRINMKRIRELLGLPPVEGDFGEEDLHAQRS